MSMPFSLLPLSLASLCLIMVSSAGALTLDFEEFQHGDIVRNSQGVTIRTTNTGGGPDLGVAFDSRRSGTADPDLEYHGGWSAGNLAPGVDTGLSLIIQEHRGSCSRTNCSNPDDEGSRAAGSFELDFTALGSFQTFSFDLIDVEDTQSEPGSIAFFRSGTQVANVSFMDFLSNPTIVFGDHSANRIVDVVSGIDFDVVRISMGGSGAVDNISVSNPVPEPSAALLFGAGLLVASRGIRARR
jgi:hypothetical protein